MELLTVFRQGCFWIVIAKESISTFPIKWGPEDGHFCDDQETRHQRVSEKQGKRDPENSEYQTVFCRATDNHICLRTSTKSASQVRGSVEEGGARLNDWNVVEGGLDG